jgi:pimeloyl-ACP methyl ester carboxylesterase
VFAWPGSPTSVRAVRQDHTLKCYGGKTIVFSLWTIQDTDGDDASNAAAAAAATSNPRPAVLYLHSAVGARPEALQALHTALRAGAHFCALDFQGSGLSEGEIVTWGWCENNDVVDAVKFLLNKARVKKLALWGRQLGAATAMSYAARDPRVSCLILDTPYSSLDDQMDLVVTQAQKEGMSVPSIVLAAATKMLKRSVRKRIAKKFDPNKLAPKRFASKCKCPALFGGDTNDGVVPPSMVKTVFNKYSKKRREMVAFTCEGSGHFGVRPAPFLQACCAFLRANLYDGKKSVPRDVFPDVADPTGAVARGAEWPPEWVAKLHFKVEVNRAMHLKEWNAARKAEAEANPPAAPATAATEDMGEVVAEEGLGGALAEFEEMAAGGGAAGGGAAGGGGAGESKKG